ncbi:MAG: hypothetical protein GY833_22225 [Aestuariibacter sp.]|nr:hypothetical protein [Aestuariibacter sp.]|tara:strand:- start:23261 stop:23494 length:234 start_codon:yes stop_codon:yes gene_type:complete
MDYFANMNTMLICMSNNARKQGGKAWDNAKRKNRRRHLPRGKTYENFEKRSRKVFWAEMKAQIDQDFKALGKEPPKL